MLAAAIALGFPGVAWAHAFGARYDLPVPLGYFVGGATAAVALSFLVAVLFMRGMPPGRPPKPFVVPLGPALQPLRAVFRLISVILLCMVVAAGFLGVANPEMNPAPVLVWIVWWVGLPLMVASVGNIWPTLDPWRTLFVGVDKIARRLGSANGISLNLPYPAWLDAWPAVFLLLLFVWIEVIYPYAASPPELATMVLIWSASTLLGMACFGCDVWHRKADMFALYFATFGRFAPVGHHLDGGGIVLRSLGNGLIRVPAESFAMVGFVMAMLATVFFDGLLGTQVLPVLHRALTVLLPGSVDERGYVLGTVGLISVWLLFLGSYLLSCLIAARLARDRSVAAVMRMFALTLVPIAIAYNVAHYFSYLVVQGQLIIPLLSDPFGRKWNVFGTATYYPDIGLLDARVTWYLAIGSIVSGHVISIWLAHRLALREFRTPRQAVIASIPLTVLMMAYTAVSLLVMAEPLVQFTQPAGPS